MTNAERWALGLSIAALTVSLVHVVVNVALFRRSGATIRVRKLKLEKHAYNPLEHKLVVTVVANGRLPAIVQEVGVSHQESGVSIDATVSDGGPALSRTLQPGESLTAEVSMETVARRLAPSRQFVLTPWAVDGTGGRRTGTRHTIKTPALPK